RTAELVPSQWGYRRLEKIPRIHVVVSQELVARAVETVRARFQPDRNVRRPHALVSREVSALYAKLFDRIDGRADRETLKQLVHVHHAIDRGSRLCGPLAIDEHVRTLGFVRGARSGSARSEGHQLHKRSEEHTSELQSLAYLV